jgi:predicted nucleotidyltransferase
MQMETVSDHLLQEMTRRLVEQFQPEQVILFDSYAWGVPTADSDVDLMVIVTHSDLSDYERAVQGHRCLSGLDVPKDVIVKTRAEFEFFREVRASLEHKISTQGKVLYDRSQRATGTGLAHQSAA